MYKLVSFADQPAIAEQITFPVTMTNGTQTKTVADQVQYDLLADMGFKAVGVSDNDEKLVRSVAKNRKTEKINSRRMPQVQAAAQAAGLSGGALAVFSGIVTKMEAEGLETFELTGKTVDDEVTLRPSAAGGVYFSIEFIADFAGKSIKGHCITPRGHLGHDKGQSVQITVNKVERNGATLYNYSAEF